MDYEDKAAVTSFQSNPPGMCHYLFLEGNHQTTNERNEFGHIALDICEEVEKKYSNTIILNESTDGVSYEV